MSQHSMRLTFLPILFFALILGIAACSPKQESPEPIRSVKLWTVGSTDLNVQGEYAAEVRARTESRLGFRVGGKILMRQAEPGQRVQAGQVLAEVDVQDYALAAQAAQALAIGARAQRDLAASDYKRYEALLAQNFISAAELERRSAVLKAAQSSLDQACKAALAVLFGPKIRCFCFIASFVHRLISHLLIALLHQSFLCYIASFNKLSLFSSFISS